MNWQGWLWIGMIIRILIMIYGEWHDSKGESLNDKFSDIDYGVYTDAARYVLNKESPYSRHTYRYTPLVSYLMLVNLWIHPCSGKLLFIMVDLIICLLLKAILTLYNSSLSQKQIAILLNIWLLNPLVITVSARGNADTIIACLVLFSLYLILKSKYLLASIMYALTVHFKIYPIVCCLSFVMFIDHNQPKWLYIITKNRLMFAFISAFLFFYSIYYFYSLYGYKFLYEAYLYHSIRKDNRTNFSIYFYYIHLNFNYVTQFQSLLTFLPQISVVLLATKLYIDPILAIFVQIFSFVLFNKVCAAQYFIWYFSLFPILFAKNNLFLQGQYFKLFSPFILWLISELGWNYSNYLLENQGYQAFINMFIMNLLFFFSNLYLFINIITHHNYRPIQIIDQQTQIKDNEKKNINKQKGK